MSIPPLDGAVAVVRPHVAGLATTPSPIGAGATAIAVGATAPRLPFLPPSLAAVRGERSPAAFAPRVSELQGGHATDPAEPMPPAAALYLVTTLSWAAFENAASRRGPSGAASRRGRSGAESLPRALRTDLDEATGAVR